MQRPWLQHYPPNVPAEVRTDVYPSIAALIEEGFSRYAEREASVCLGSSLRFGQIAEMSEALGAWLQARGLAPGARSIFAGRDF